MKRQTSYKEVNLQYDGDGQSVFTFACVQYDTLYCDFYMFSSFNIDLGVVRWPPARSCGSTVMYVARPSLFTCAVLSSGFRDTG